MFRSKIVHADFEVVLGARDEFLQLCPAGVGAYMTDQWDRPVCGAERNVCRRVVEGYFRLLSGGDLRSDGRDDLSSGRVKLRKEAGASEFRAVISGPRGVFGVFVAG